MGNDVEGLQQAGHRQTPYKTHVPHPSFPTSFPYVYPYAAIAHAPPCAAFLSFSILRSVWGWKTLAAMAEGVQLSEDETYYTPELAEAFEGGNCKDNIFRIA